ncbi:Ribosome assembly protein 1 (EF-2 like GTPase) (Elongation factor-like 1), partial [Durusdinium trenchii]
MDSRQDEQEREITMKSSSIALRWLSPKNEAFLVNLIDSPGHVDFTSEAGAPSSGGGAPVSTAARLADGALVVVDCVEGVEAQTRTVLRQAYRDRVKSCLFLNKVDRLIYELKLSPMDIHLRLLRIVEQINAANQQLFSEEVMAGAATSRPRKGSGEALDAVDLSEELDFDDEDRWRYSPELGNVAFGSAVHGWAFRLERGSAKPQNLQRVLWGDWTYRPKDKKAVMRSSDSQANTMFASLVMKPICDFYDSVYMDLDRERLKGMRKQIKAWDDVDFDKLTAGPAATKELASRWLPFADSVLRMVSELPSPAEAAPQRLPVLCPKWFTPKAIDHPVARDLQLSDPNGSCVVYLAKFLAADLENLVLTGDTPKGEQDVDFVGICRVFSGREWDGGERELGPLGTLRPGLEVHMQPDPSRVLRVQRIFLLMGRFLQEVTEAPSGSIVAIALEGESSELGVERCLTLCEDSDGPSFETPYSNQAFAIVRVSIEPEDVANLKALERGLRLLHRADPSVSVEAMVTGENVLGCCGDEHLKRCLNDLEKLYARNIKLLVTPPLVAVRESFAKSVERPEFKVASLFLPIWMSHLHDASTEAPQAAGSMMSIPSDDDTVTSDAGPAATLTERWNMSQSGVMSVWTANRKACVRLSAIALPDEVLAWMDEHAEALESVVHRQQASIELVGSSDGSLMGCLAEVEQQFRQLQEQSDPSFQVCNDEEISLCGMSVDRGSRTLLLDGSGSGWRLRDAYDTAFGLLRADEGGVPEWMRPHLLAGFGQASTAGPLCEESSVEQGGALPWVAEPLRGVAFLVHGASGSFREDEDAAALAANPFGPMSGQVMVATKDACRYCLLRKGFSRISEAMLSVDLNCEQHMLGKVYAVLSKRRAKVQGEVLREGTSIFYVHAYLPLANSFDLAKQLRQAASGHVSFHVAFSHWELSEEDPFQSMSSPEDLEEMGDQPPPPNTARKLVDDIRKRKGLPTDEKVVKDATKQRTEEVDGLLQLIADVRGESLEVDPVALNEVRIFLQEHEAESAKSATHLVLESYPDWWVRKKRAPPGLDIQGADALEELYRHVGFMHSLGVPMTLAERRTAQGFRFFQDLEAWGSREAAPLAETLFGPDSALTRLIGTVVGEVFPSHGGFLDVAVYNATGLSQTKGVRKLSLRLVWPGILTDADRALRVRDLLVNRLVTASAEGGALAELEAELKKSNASNGWHSFMGDAAYSSRAVVRMPLCDRVAPLPLRGPEKRPFNPVGVLRYSFSGEKMTVEWLCKEADLESAEWMKIGCLRQEGEVQLSDWRMPAYHGPQLLPLSATRTGRVKVRTTAGSDGPSIGGGLRLRKASERAGQLQVVERSFSCSPQEFAEKMEQQLGK